jgi:hypothetical protein
VRHHGVGIKRLQHPIAGLISLEHSAFAVHGAEGLSMVVFTPATPADERAIEALLSRKGLAA